jgi:hypothetical protein
MSIYERPTKELMKEFAEQELEKDQIFDKELAVRWFARNYPKIKKNTVQMHVEGMAINAPVRKHHPNIHPGSSHDLFFKVAPGKFRLWKPETDIQPLYRDDLLSMEEEAIESETEEDELAISKEFAFERDLRNYLSRNMEAIEPGMRLYEEEDITGIEFPAGNRFIDILALDRADNFVVIELKVSRGYDRVIGQILRYIGWVEQNIAEDKNVRGVIVASEITDDLKLACSKLPYISLIEYEISLSLKKY